MTVIKEQQQQQRVFTLEHALSVILLKHRPPLKNFAEMWYQIFLWALFSSVFVHLIAAVIAFTTLRKHRFGNLGIFAPMTSGVLSSASIGFVYRAAGMEMMPMYALFWGVGQTFVSAAVGFTRILATL